MFATECLRNSAKRARLPRQRAQFLSDRSTRAKGPERIRREETRKTGAANCCQSNGPGGWIGNSPSSNSTVVNTRSDLPTRAIGTTGSPTAGVERRTELIFPMMANGNSLTGFQSNRQTRMCTDSKTGPVPMHAFRTLLANTSCRFTSSPIFRLPPMVRSATAVLRTGNKCSREPAMIPMSIAMRCSHFPNSRPEIDPFRGSR